MTVEEFLDWNGSQTHRHELIDGYAVPQNKVGAAKAMAGASEGHGVAVANLVVALTPQTRARGGRTASSDLAVRTGNDRIRYPDVLVWCEPKTSDGKEIENPLLMVEVLSRSNAGMDFVDKIAEYQSHPTVLYILILSPFRVDVTFYRRPAADAPWQHTKLSSLEDIIEMDGLGVRLAVRDIYVDLDPRPYLELVD